MISSQALSVILTGDVWHGDIGATEHMTDKLEWFSTFAPIPDGSWLSTSCHKQ
jgi:hypothetical protein